MSLSTLLSRWKGLALAILGIVLTTWLALSGRLGLYIHPRYFVFTVIMAVLALVVTVLACAVPGDEGEEPHDHDHDHDHDDARGAIGTEGDSRHPTPSRLRLLGSLGTGVLLVSAAIACIVIAPSTLTAGTAQQREVNAASVSEPDGEPVLAAGTDTSDFTVKDWAAALRAGLDPAEVSEVTPTVLGFVTPDESDPDNVFFVARFVITCCAVDAQPVGVPVYLPGWQDQFPVGSWVEATGSFQPNPSVIGDQQVALVDAAVVPAAEPGEPYVY